MAAEARLARLDRAGLGTVAIMRTADVGKTADWRWQQRFMTEGTYGLLRDKTRPARVPKLTDDVAERIVALTLGEPPGGSHDPGRCPEFQISTSHDVPWLALDCPSHPEWQLSR